MKYRELNSIKKMTGQGADFTMKCLNQTASMGGCSKVAEIINRYCIGSARGLILTKLQEAISGYTVTCVTSLSEVEKIMEVSHITDVKFIN